MKHLDDFYENGFTTFDDVYRKDEVDNILQQIDQANIDKATFKKSADLFAIRQFLNEVPSALNMIINEKLKRLLKEVFRDKYFVVKSIFFDKPPTSNWHVSCHQDLTISVDKKYELHGFDHWTTKQNHFAVQPPLAILQSIVTVRIHLDDTDKDNGALKVVPGSHLNGIHRAETINWSGEQQVYCDVSQGGVMLLKPLLLHSSSRTTNYKRRRVIHVEFCNQELQPELQWAERININ